MENDIKKAITSELIKYYEGFLNGTPIKENKFLNKDISKELIFRATKDLEANKYINDLRTEQGKVDYDKRFVVIGVVKGAHYELSFNNESSETTYEEAYEIMLTWKNSFNDSREAPFLFSAKIGETVDMIRTDTIEKMYIKTMLIQKEDK